jgi:hypothetical protein
MPRNLYVVLDASVEVDLLSLDDDADEADDAEFLLFVSDFSGFL